MLFNAFEPGATSGGKADELPMLSGYGKVLKGSQRQDKRNAAQRGLDRAHGFFSSAYVRHPGTIVTAISYELLSWLLYCNRRFRTRATRQPTVVSVARSRSNCEPATR